MNQEISSSDRDILANILTRSGRVGTTIQQQTICMKIQIDEDIVFFIGISASDFSTQLINYLNKIGNFDALIRLCDLLVQQLGLQYQEQLLDIRLKLLPLSSYSHDTGLVADKPSTNGALSLKVEKTTFEADIILPAESTVDMAILEEVVQTEGSVVPTDRTDSQESAEGISDTLLARLLSSISDIGIRCLEERLRMNPKHWRKEDLPMPDAWKSHVAKYFEGVATRLLQRYDNLAALQEDLSRKNFNNRGLVTVAQNMLDEVAEEMGYLGDLLGNAPPHSMAISIERAVSTVVSNEQAVRNILPDLKIAIIRGSAVPGPIKSRTAVLIRALTLSIKNLRNQMQSIAVEAEREFERLTLQLNDEGDDSIAT